jgi:hypothetical protein
MPASVVGWGFVGALYLEESKMKRLHVLGAATLAVLVCADLAMARGAARSGARGAVVGGMVGGESGAQTGAKIGVVAGATRGAVERAEYRSDQQTAVTQEAQARAQYASTAAYQSTPHSDFNQSPPEVLATSATVATPAQNEESVINQNGKPILAITYPSDWKLKKGDHAITATSADGQAWSALSTLPDAKDKQAALAKVKEQLTKNLQEVEFDELTKTESGALLVTGTAKGKKTGADVVFAAGVFDATPQQLAAAAFIVDKAVEENYKETLKCIAQTIRTQQGHLAQQ